MTDFDSDTITHNYTAAILGQCNAIENQLVNSEGIDKNYTRLLSIQATYNSFKLLVSQLNDKEIQEEVFKLFESDAKNLVFTKVPTVDVIGHA